MGCGGRGGGADHSLPGFVLQPEERVWGLGEERPREQRQRQAEPEGSNRGCDTTIFPSSVQV